MNWDPATHIGFPGFPWTKKPQQEVELSSSSGTSWMTTASRFASPLPSLLPGGMRAQNVKLFKHCPLVLSAQVHSGDSGRPGVPPEGPGGPPRGPIGPPGGPTGRNLRRIIEEEREGRSVVGSLTPLMLLTIVWKMSWGSNLKMSWGSFLSSRDIFSRIFYYRQIDHVWFDRHFFR